MPNMGDQQIHDVYGMTNGEMAEILKKARITYGNKNQILVCIEELNELACVLAKYPRYDDDSKATKELYDKALDEVADVYTILEHVKAIFGITENTLWMRRSVKAGRLKRWLNHSDSMTETVKDRAIEGDMCEGCHRDKKHFGTYTDYCVHCLKAQATEGIAPYKE